MSENTRSNGGDSPPHRAMNASVRRSVGAGLDMPLCIGGLPSMAQLNSFVSTAALAVSAASLGLFGCSADGGGQSQGPGTGGPPGYFNPPGSSATPGVGNGAGGSAPVM